MDLRKENVSGVSAAEVEGRMDSMTTPALGERPTVGPKAVKASVPLDVNTSSASPDDATAAAR
ncbi:MAG: hypothetical protein ACRET7_11885 [Burkholderiales bacterium]